MKRGGPTDRAIQAVADAAVGLLFRLNGVPCDEKETTR